jgi:hypothetical protein
MIRPFAILLTLAGIATATEANAQSVVYRGYAPPATYGSTTYSSSYSGGQPTRTYSYSYYTRSPYPARTYVGYGSSDFPYHGAPYGHAYDPWTWPMMSGSYGKGLARYYDPPVK